MASAACIMIFCSQAVLRTMQMGTSKSTMALQKQVQKTLYAQFFIPFIFIHIPFYSICLAPFLNIRSTGISDYLPILFAWSPAINPIMVLYVVGDFRRFLINTLKRKKIGASNSYFIPYCT
uniref:G_PROTEIN_RECEP_F1_2 domain-containing protein n=1 Tax=Heterorhabditis bacteriophora TaxID=37862 RepID=A0A1I7WI58_HETBA